MPQWIHDRAKHIRAKNPEMSESESWAIATQQAHASGKSPKNYGTVEGRREANKKYDKPAHEYKQTANPPSKPKLSMMSVALLGGFSDELQKIAFAGVPKLPGPPKLPKPSVKPTSLAGTTNTGSIPNTLSANVKPPEVSAPSASLGTHSKGNAPPPVG